MDYSNNNKVKVLVATPNFGNQFTAEAFQGHVNCVAAWTKMGLDFNWTVIGRSFVHFARTQACRAAMDGGFTHLFWLDDDAIIDPSILPRFLKHDVEIVMAPYPMRRPPYEIGVLVSETGDIHDPDSYRNFELEDLDQGLIEVDGGGTHAMLVRMDVFRKHGDPAPKSDYPADLAKIFDALDQDQHKILAHYLGDLPDEALSLEEEDDMGRSYFMMPKTGTEDMFFCYRAKKKGIKIWCDTDVFANHVGFTPVVTRAFREVAAKAQATPGASQETTGWIPTEVGLGRDHHRIGAKATSNLV